MRASRARSRDVKLLLVFEGGGAKGLVHVAALAAIEKRWSSPAYLGFPGASAGALVAGLAAAGWTADELLGPSGRSRVLSATGVGSATELVPNWRGIRLAKTMAATFVRFWPLLAAPALGALVRIEPRLAEAGSTFATLGAALAAPFLFVQTAVDVARLRAISRRDAASPGGGARLRRARRGVEIDGFCVLLGAALLGAAHAAQPLVAPIAVLLAVVCLVCAGRLLQGLSTADRLVEKLDEALAAGIEKDGKGKAKRPVAFGELQARREVALRIIATDYSSGRLQTFSERRTPDASVARAMAASAAIPVAFAPVHVAARSLGPSGAWFCDGGLVSNLPVWAIDDLRESEPDAEVVVSGIAPPRSRSERNGALPSAAGWLALFKSALFGSRLLETRGAVHNVTMLSTESALDVLDFDAIRNEAGEARRLGEAAVNLQLDNKEIADLLEAQLFGELMRAFYEAFVAPKAGRRPTPERISRGMRAHIASSSFAEEATRIVASSVDDDPTMLDNRLVLPLGRSVVSRALDAKRPIFEDRPPKSPRFGSGSPADRYREPLVWPSLRWVIAAPLSTALAPASRLTQALEAADSASNGSLREFRGRLRRSALVLDGSDIFPDRSWRSSVPQAAVDMLSSFSEYAVWSLAYRILTIEQLNAISLHLNGSEDDDENWP